MFCIQIKSTVTNILVRTAMTVLAVGLINSTNGEIDYKCTFQDEFYYASPNSQCTSYYKCYQRQSLKFDCTSGTVFDFYKQKCTRSAGVCYEPVCTGRVDGTHQDTTHACRRSIICHGGVLVGVDNCPHGYLHDGESCQPQEYVSCDLPEVTAVAYPYAGDKRCNGLINGNHGIQDNNCRKYIVCKNDEVVDEMECPIALRYETKTKRCSVAYDVPCYNVENTGVCYYKSDGYHVDHSTGDCRSYIRCFNGNLIATQTCGFNSIFNGEKCVPTPLYECPALQIDICRKKTDGLQPNPYKGCSSYVKCLNGKTVQNSECSKGNYFDPERKQCVYERYEENKKCRSASNSGDCSYLASGQFYQDKSTSSSCKEYFFCFNGNRTQFKCSLGTVFNGETCISEENYKCPNLDPNSCDLKKDGYYKDKSGGCRSYYFCSSTKKFSYLCAEGQFFDGTKCTEKKQGELCGNTECLDKIDGYYSDHTTNCRNYYYCLKGEKATSLTCRGSKIFNGSSCVSPDQFTCPTEVGGLSSSLSCVQRKCHRNECKKDGFYSDLDSKCKNYYFCITGKKTVLSCTDGYVFNGEICVPSESYQCPRYCANHLTNC